MIVSQWLKWATDQLVRVENPRMEAEMLLTHVMQISKTQCITQSEKVLSPVDEEKLNLLLERRKKSEPMAYIIGQKPFWTFTLKVTPDVLIPRPETETLVEQVLAAYSAPHLKVLDLGTGSGAIAIALALERPSWKITAVDCSAYALKVAEENAKQLNVKNIQWLQSNWFSNLGQNTFDIIVSNPPYVAENDPEWHLESKHYEPPSALIGGGEDGLNMLRTIAINALQHLNPNGSLFLEHGYQQGQIVRNFLQAHCYHSIKTIKDLSGKERMTWGYCHSRENCLLKESEFVIK